MKIKELSGYKQDQPTELFPRAGMLLSVLIRVHPWFTPVFFGPFLTLLPKFPNLPA
jgi:hypothetical protein